MGSIKLLQFRLDFDVGYNDRWRSLDEAIRLFAPNNWDEATASFLFQHPNTVDELLVAILQNSTVYRDGRDMLMILDTKTLKVAQIGVKDRFKLNQTLASGAPGLGQMRAS